MPMLNMLWSTVKAVQIGSAKSAAAYDLTISYVKKKEQISITHTREGIKISMMWQFCAIAGREGNQLLRVSSSKQSTVLYQKATNVVKHQEALTK
jgi:hypothetical protein